jgi:hypothetical protein
VSVGSRLAGHEQAGNPVEDPPESVVLASMVTSAEASPASDGGGSLVGVVELEQPSPKTAAKWSPSNARTIRIGPGYVVVRIQPGLRTARGARIRGAFGEVAGRDAVVLEVALHGDDRISTGTLRVGRSRRRDT